MKKYIVEKDWLEEEGMPAFPDLYETVYLASEVDAERDSMAKLTDANGATIRKLDARIADLEKALSTISNNVMCPHFFRGDREQGTNGEQMSNVPKSWQDWIDSEDGKRCANPVTLQLPTDQYEYLRNRLWHAFVAGMACQEATSQGKEDGQ